MNKNVTVEEVRARKILLEMEVRRLIQEFELQTGLTIDAIQIGHTGRPETPVDVKIISRL